ncbi:MAG: NAD(P)H-hydrate dehydratase [Microbacteriaceae bacterium]|nr:NAD(P)H-hydrate dehydratase [Microbacteriaceae bacterium]
MTNFSQWLPDAAARHIAVPTESDDKYSRGVLGVITGSDQYPGAAVLGVEAALRTGVGMVRYLGGERVSTLVLQRRPEAVTSEGRVQAWLIGSGTDYANRDDDSRAATTLALAQSLPTVLDGGALALHAASGGPVVITPHHGELARLLGVGRDVIAADPGTWAERAAAELGVTVLLKGHQSFVSGGGLSLVAASAPNWLATAGSGDALAGILGALVATHSEEAAADPGCLARLAASAAVLHGLAGQRASAGGPVTILDLAAALPPTIAGLLASPGEG